MNRSTLTQHLMKRGYSKHQLIQSVCTQQRGPGTAHESRS